jgi:hypothetical protein
MHFNYYFFVINPFKCFVFRIKCLHWGFNACWRWWWCCMLKNALGQPHIFRYTEYLSPSFNFLGKILWACQNVLRDTVRFLAATYRGADKSLALPGRKRLAGHLQPRRNWRTWASSVLITHPILRIWPRRTTTYSLDWRKQLKGKQVGLRTYQQPCTQPIQ